MEHKTKKTVLLVEDDVALNRAVSFKLNQGGNKVLSTFGAEEALSILKFKHDAIDIVWLDLLLPGMSGMDFLSKIRKDDGLKDLKVVVCSVSGGEDSKSISRSLGAVDYLIKSDYNLNSLTEKALSYA